MRCPICGEDASTSVKAVSNPYDAEKYTHGPVIRYTVKRPKATLTLIFINVLVFLAITFLSYKDIDLVSALSMHRGAVYSGQYYRILTSIFTHSELWHLASNCYALYIFGQIVEAAVGTKRFLIIYFIGGILGNVLTFGFMSVSSIGASGAIFGLLGALIAIHYIVPGYMSRGMLTNILFCIVLTTVFSLRGGINNLAHFGGIAGGYVAMCLLTKRRIQKKFITNRIFLSILLAFVLIGSGIYGSNNIQGANETMYGKYSNMTLAASSGNYKIAALYADSIIEKGESDYIADALAARIIYDSKTGDTKSLKNNYEQFYYYNQTKKVPMHNKKIYNEFTNALNSSAGLSSIK
ncbi:MAG: rhomboid family intramembrane serine protease [Bacillota bacterium]|nr:rhomboid family intramembrane serine protease [Bacillota bacterium]